MAARTAGGRGVPAEDVRAQLERILASDQFRRSDRLSRFFRFVVEEALCGRGRNIKEYVIATEVFDKPREFDPRVDPIVRVEARRLRAKLLDYYSDEGRADAVSISIKKHGYVPEFALQARQGSEDAGQEHGPSPPVGRTRLPPGAAVAVLPFVDMSREGDHDHFCDGLTEELINTLTGVRGLQVISRSSSFQFRGLAQDVRKVGEDLGAAVVLEGSVRKNGRKVRITAHLSRANDGVHLWSETYDAELDDEFSVQETLASKIAETLVHQRGEPLMPALDQKHTRVPEAYKHYLKGLYHRSASQPNQMLAGCDAFQAAIDADPGYAQAYAGLAACWAKIGWFGSAPALEAWPRSEAAAIEALKIDNEVASAHAALGAAYCVGRWDWAEGERAFQRAFEIDANDFTALHWYPLVFLAPRGRLDEAFAVLRKAVEVGGHSVYAHTNLGQVHFFRGETADAIEICRQVLQTQPQFLPALWDLARAYIHEQRYDEAEETIEEALRYAERSPFSLGLLGVCWARSGKESQARKVARELRSLSSEVYVSPLIFARLEVALSDIDRAFDRLDGAVSDRSSSLIEIDIDPMFAPLRQDPRIRKIRRTIGLADPDRIPRQ